MRPLFYCCRVSCRDAKIRPVRSGSRRTKQHKRACGLPGRRVSDDRNLWLRPLDALWTVALLALLAGCRVAPTTKVWRAQDFTVRAGELHRLAVLPFRDGAPPRGVLWWLGRPFVWLGRLVSLNFDAPPPTSSETAVTLRTLLVARLQGEAVSIVNPSMVDQTLAALPADFDRRDHAALARALDVDGVITGELRAVGASYWLFSTHRELVGEVQLHCGSDGATVFTAFVRVDDSAGIDHGPTGFLSLVAVPLAALDSGPYTSMAIAWADEVGQALLGNAQPDRARARPTITSLSVDAPYRPLREGDRIIVTIEGSAGAEANFDLGTLHREIPMAVDTEAPAGRSRYRGFYTVRAGDRIDRAPVIARLAQPSGGTVSRRSDRLIDIPTD
jgi:hypothetical protein